MIKITGLDVNSRAVILIEFESHWEDVFISPS